MASTSAVRSVAVRPLRNPRPAGWSTPRLTVLAAPKAAGSAMPFTLLCTAIVVATLAALLYLNIQMSDTSYEINRLQIQSQRLTEEQQSLAAANERLGTPQELERQARELGMVPVADPAYIDLDTRTVLSGTVGAEAAAPAVQLAEVPAERAVPPARIYDQPEAYHGMGNEGA